MLVNGDWRHPQKVLFAVPAVSENRTQGLRQAQGGGTSQPHIYTTRGTGVARCRVQINVGCPMQVKMDLGHIKRLQAGTRRLDVGDH